MDTILKKTAGALAAVWMLGCLAGCQSPDVKTSVRTGAVKAVAVFPKNAAYSNAVKNGMVLAQAQINAQGGVLGAPLALQFVDCGADDAKGDNAVGAALAQNPDVLWLAGDIAAWQAPRVMEKNVLACFLSEYPPVPSLTPLGARVFLNGPTMANAVFQVAHNSDIASVVVICEEGAVNNSMAEYLAFLMQGDGIRVWRDGFSTGEKNFALLADGIRQLNPDAIYFVGGPMAGDALIAALEKTGYAGIILGLYGEGLPPVAGTLEALRRKLIYPLPEKGMTAAFVEAYRKTFGENPGPLAAYGYENVKRVAAAAVAQTRSAQAWRASMMRDNACYAWKDLTFARDADTDVPLALHVPEGVKMPAKIERDAPKTAPEKHGPIFLLDPGEYPAKE